MVVAVCCAIVLGWALRSCSTPHHSSFLLDGWGPWEVLKALKIIGFDYPFTVRAMELITGMDIASWSRNIVFILGGIAISQFVPNPRMNSQRGHPLQRLFNSDASGHHIHALHRVVHGMPMVTVNGHPEI